MSLNSWNVLLYLSSFVAIFFWWIFLCREIFFFLISDMAVLLAFFCSHLNYLCFPELPISQLHGPTRVEDLGQPSWFLGIASSLPLLLEWVVSLLHGTGSLHFFHFRCLFFLPPLVLPALPCSFSDLSRAVATKGAPPSFWWWIFFCWSFLDLLLIKSRILHSPHSSHLCPLPRTWLSALMPSFLLVQVYPSRCYLK